MLARARAAAETLGAKIKFLQAMPAITIQGSTFDGVISVSASEFVPDMCSAWRNWILKPGGKLWWAKTTPGIIFTRKRQEKTRRAYLPMPGYIACKNCGMPCRVGECKPGQCCLYLRILILAGSKRPCSWKPRASGPGVPEILSGEDNRRCKPVTGFLKK